MINQNNNAKLGQCHSELNVANFLEYLQDDDDQWWVQ